MDSNTLINSWIPTSVQVNLVDEFIQYDQHVQQIAQKYISDESRNMNINYVIQWVYLIILLNIFGIDLGTIYSILTSDRAQILNKYFLDRFKYFTSRSWAYKHASDLFSIHKFDIEAISESIQDSIYLKIGNSFRKQANAVYNEGKQKITPPIEAFLGLVSPSSIFPDLSVFERGKRLPYFNARIYMHINHISSISELVGCIKEIEICESSYSYRIAGRLGFIHRPPGKGMFYQNFPLIEDKLQFYEEIIDEMLSIEEIHDFHVISVDCCNVPVDKRDKSASNGVGSRGSFFGQKASIGAGTYCLPVNSVTKSGNSADISLYRETMQPILDLAKKVKQEIWIQTADAAYTSTYLIDDIIASGSVPFIDINPRASKLLKTLKQAAANLEDLSKKAIKNGLAPDERKGYLSDLRLYEMKHPRPISYNEKIKVLKRLLKNWADYARYHGLKPAEQLQEWKFRKKIQICRQIIRTSGTWAENKIAQSIVMQGTIEWFLVYHIRGQNEGINGILKKRGNMIGDGQHTTWGRGLKSVRIRIESEIVMYKTSSLVYKLITGRIRHSMRRIYNWRVRFYIFIFWTGFYRKTPIIYL